LWWQTAQLLCRALDNAVLFKEAAKLAAHYFIPKSTLALRIVVDPQRAEYWHHVI
jgi:hypothetical protein